MNQHGQIALKGFAMGMADLVPGVSGGTIAFIAGIYDPLLNSLWPSAAKGSPASGVGSSNWPGRPSTARSCWPSVCILTAVVTLAAPLHWLLEHEPVMLRAFFTGLVAASVPLVGRHLAPWNAQAWVWAAVGCAVAGFVTSLPPLVQSTSAFGSWVPACSPSAPCCCPAFQGAFCC